MNKALVGFLHLIADAARDLAPIILVIAFFQIVVLQQPFPNLPEILVGLVVVSDIASNVLAKNMSPDRVNVCEIMSKPVLSLPAEMNIVYAVRMLSKFGLSRAMAIDHDRNPLGFVTMRDIVLRNIQDEEPR